ncbi:MAG TPA: hypothetical protein P5159_01940 [Phycisphaerae bacterium]|nr:hypothetical protein [Phycisphaerae bacterium]
MRPGKGAVPSGQWFFHLDRGCAHEYLPYECGDRHPVDRLPGPRFVGACEYNPRDFDGDADIDADDLRIFVACVSGPAVVYSGDCSKADLDKDDDVGQTDFGILQRCFFGANSPPACGS